MAFGFGGAGLAPTRFTRSRRTPLGRLNGTELFQLAICAINSIPMNSAAKKVSEAIRAFAPPCSCITNTPRRAPTSRNANKPATAATPRFCAFATSKGGDAFTFLMALSAETHPGAGVKCAFIHVVSAANPMLPSATPKMTRSPLSGSVRNS